MCVCVCVGFTVFLLLCASYTEYFEMSGMFTMYVELFLIDGKIHSKPQKSPL